MLATLRELLIGPVQQLLKLRHPAAVIVGVYRTIGESLQRGTLTGMTHLSALVYESNIKGLRCREDFE